MRIALVHSYYSDDHRSGENVTVDEQAGLLAAAGHEVHVEARRTLVERDRPGYAVRSAVRVATGRGDSPTPALARFAPDVVHVHNLFPNFGTAWLGDWRGPVVATLHNFRCMCANGLLLRDGRTCVDCPTGSSSAAVRHACYRGSRLATVPLAIATHRPPTRDPVIRRADRLVVLADHALAVFTRFGVPADRCDVVPHAIAPRHAGAVPGPAVPRFLTVARFAPEKGVVELARDWPADVLLDIVGGGAGAPAVEAAAAANPAITLLGPRDASWRDTASDYSAVVVPGLCLEASVPRVVLEAMEAGVPVVIHEAGGGADVVRAADAGRTYHDATSLRTALAQIVADGASRREAARAAYLAGHTPADWLAAIEATYARAASSAS